VDRAIVQKINKRKFQLSIRLLGVSWSYSIFGMVIRGLSRRTATTL
jgi:hypothetical protein